MVDLFESGLADSAIVRAVGVAKDWGTTTIAWASTVADRYDLGQSLARLTSSFDARNGDLLAKRCGSMSSHLDADGTGITSNDSVFSPHAIRSYIDEASAQTGISRDYLCHLAQKESALDPIAVAGTSSASGLFQFTEATWIEVFARYGEQHGQTALVEEIDRGADGRLYIANESMRRRILNLRFDPKLSTFMVAHYSNEHIAYLEKSLARRPNYAELYIAHFLGPHGAGKLFDSVQHVPSASAVKLFPAAANSNRRFFYDKNGRGVDVATLYTSLMQLSAGFQGQEA